MRITSNNKQNLFDLVNRCEKTFQLISEKKPFIFKTIKGLHFGI